MLRAAVLAVAALAAGGCADAIKTMLVFAPNRAMHEAPTADQDPDLRELRLLGIDRQDRLEVGPPEASILTWTVEPRPRDAEGGYDFDAPPSQPKGTVFLLHGYRLSMFWLRGFAHQIAAGGYRVILMDLRGHGHSTGEWITYGVVESADLNQVIDQMKQRGRIEGPIGLWGISMGAVTCLRTAAQRDDVAAVVAVAPYSRLRDVAPGVMEMGTLGVGALYSEKDKQRMIEEAARDAGFDPDQAECVDAVKTLAASLLVVHGRMDWVAPIEQGRSVYESAGCREKKFLELSVGHLGAHFDPEDLIATETVRWYDRHLKPTPPAKTGG
jgi:pimeloyl-ACP methyl ester carboxylesterase